MSELWDPNFASPNESDAFWMAQEYTTGGSNQSTQFAPIQDPLPFFVGTSVPGANDGENECTAPGPCSLTFSPPANALPTDLT